MEFNNNWSLGSIIKVFLKTIIIVTRVKNIYLQSTFHLPQKSLKWNLKGWQKHLSIPHDSPRLALPSSKDPTHGNISSEWNFTPLLSCMHLKDHNHVHPWTDGIVVSISSQLPCGLGSDWAICFTDVRLKIWTSSDLCFSKKASASTCLVLCLKKVTHIHSGSGNNNSTWPLLDGEMVTAGK